MMLMPRAERIAGERGLRRVEGDVRAITEAYA